MERGTDIPPGPSKPQLQGSTPWRSTGGDSTYLLATPLVRPTNCRR